MSLSTRRTPERTTPMLSGVILEKVIPVDIIASTGSGVVTMTPAQALSGLLRVDCQDAQTLTTPTATLLNQAIAGAEVGTTFYVRIINYGDSTLTIGLGTGVTKTTIASVAPVMTIATLASKVLMFNCTGIAQGTAPGGTTDSWVIYAFGSTAAAVA